MHSSAYFEIDGSATLLEAADKIVAEYPDLDDLFRRFARLPIENVASLGGTNVSRLPVREVASVLFILKTLLVLRSNRAPREIGLNGLEFVPGEYIHKIRIPFARPHEIVRSYTATKRCAGEISTISMAARMSLLEDWVRDIKLAFAGVRPTIVRPRLAETMIRGKYWHPRELGSARKALEQEFLPIDGPEGAAVNRGQLCGDLLLRFASDTQGESTLGVQRYSASQLADLNA